MKCSKKQILVSMIPFLTLMPSAGWADVSIPQTQNSFMELINKYRDDLTDADLKELKLHGIDKKTFKYCKKNDKSDEKKSGLEHFIEGLSIDINLKEKFNITDGVKINGGYRITAETSIGKKYARVDSWEAGGSLSTQVLGGFFKYFNMGIGVERQISYTRLFNSQRESICQFPYNPIDHTPITTEVFKKLKPGDLLSFSAPLTFTLGGVLPSNLVKILELSKFSLGAGYMGISGEVAYAVTGDFDVNLLVIDKDHVRVRILVSKDTTIGLSAGLRISGLSLAGDIISSVLINPKILTGIIESSESDLNVADYIFNLKDSTASELYNKLIGPKLKFANAELAKEKILALIENPDKVGEERLKELFKDAVELNKIAEEDQNLPIDKKRIIKLLNLNNSTDASKLSLKINLGLVAQVKRSFKRIENSLFTIYSDFFESNSGRNVKIKLDSIVSNETYKLFHLKTTHNVTNSIMANVAERDIKNLGLRPGVPEHDSKFDAYYFQGYQYSSIFKQRRISIDDANKIKEHLVTSLPPIISKQLKFENWKIDKDLHNFYLQQDITFTSKLFNLKTPISSETIREALRQIIEAGTKRGFSAKPIGIVGSHSINSPLIERKFVEKNFIGAYGFEKTSKHDTDEADKGCNFECLDIPAYLADVLNSTDSNIADRYFKLEVLLRYYPLFVEVAPELLFKIIPENELASVLDLHIIVSAKGKETVTINSQSTDKGSALLARQLLSFMAYLESKGSDNPNDNRVLRQYYNDDGLPFTAVELIELKEQLRKVIKKGG